MAMQTKQVRLYEDLVEMIADIHDVTGQMIADMLDPLVREHIEETHKRLQPSIRQIKAARAKHAKPVETVEG